MSDTRNHGRETYVKPELVIHDNLREITFECPDWQCSVWFRRRRIGWNSERHRGVAPNGATPC